MKNEELELFLKYNFIEKRVIEKLLRNNGLKYEDIMLIDTIQYPTLNSQFDSPFFNYRTFLTQVNRYLQMGKDIYVPKYAILFHGTSGRNVESITSKGLLTTTNKMRNSLQSTNGFVYLAPQYNIAYDFGRFVNPDEIAVFAVVCKINRLSIDMDQIKNCRLFKKNIEIRETLADSLWFGNSVRVKGKIDKNQIVQVI